MDLDKVLGPIFKKIGARVGRGLSDTEKRNLLRLLGGPMNAEDVKIVKFEADRQLKFWGALLRGVDNEGALIADKPAGNTGKWFERRVYLVDFVLSRIYTLQELFIPLMNDTPIPKKPFKWRELIIEWNEVNPSDKLRNANSLKAAFTRHMKDKPVMVEILRREIAEETELYQGLVSAVEAYEKLVAQLPPGYPIPPKARAMWGGLQNFVRKVEHEG